MEPNDIKYLSSNTTANSNLNLNSLSTLEKHEKPCRPPRSVEPLQKLVTNYQHKKSFSSSMYDNRLDESNNINRTNLNNSNFNVSEMHEVVGSISNGYNSGKPTVQVNNLF